MKGWKLLLVLPLLFAMQSGAFAGPIGWDDDTVPVDPTMRDEVQRTLEAKYIEQKLLDLGMDLAEIVEGMPTLADAEVHYFATNLDVIERGGEVTGKTVAAGLCSFFIWPGIGQYINDCEPKKNWWHAGLGLTGIFRLFSGPDAFIGRTNGFWDGRI